VGDAIERLAVVPVTWDDGSSTTLALSVETGPDWACSHQWVETPCPYWLATPLRMRVSSGDGRLDLVLPALIEVEVAGASAVGSQCGTAEREGWTGALSVEIAAIVPSSALAQSAMLLDELPTGSALSVSLIAQARGESIDQLRLRLGAIPLGSDAPELDAVVDATTEGATLNCYPSATAIASAAFGGRD